jgi:hypothetical protein
VNVEGVAFLFGGAGDGGVPSHSYMFVMGAINSVPAPQYFVGSATVAFFAASADQICRRTYPTWVLVIRPPSL